MNDDRRAALGAAARMRAEREFSWASIAKRTLAVYKDCLAPGAQGRGAAAVVDG